MAEPFLTLTHEDRQVRQLLQELLDRAGDLRPALTDIGEELVFRTDEGFEFERDPFGNPWQPLSAYTLSWKAANSRILKILQSTGRLRSSITYSVESDRVIVGTNVAYAKKPQLGIEQPQRQFLGIGPEAKAEIIQILEEYLAGYQ